MCVWLSVLHYVACSHQCQLPVLQPLAAAGCELSWHSEISDLSKAWKHTVSMAFALQLMIFQRPPGKQTHCKHTSVTAPNVAPWQLP